MFLAARYAESIASNLRHVPRYEDGTGTSVAKESLALAARCACSRLRAKLVKRIQCMYMYRRS